MAVETQKISQPLLQLVLNTFDHAVELMRGKGKGPFPPVLMFESHEDAHEAVSFLDKDPRKAIDLARARVSELPATKKRYAIAFFGYVTINGTRMEAILVDAGERGDPHGFTYFQRMRTRKLLATFGRIGQPVWMAAGPNYFDSPPAPAGG